MARTRTVYRCSECGYETGRWLGRCPSCGAWNALSEAQTAPMRTQSGSGPAPQAPLLGELPQTRDARTRTGIEELDRVLGGGVVAGSLLLVGGDPGVGKSTLLLQAAANLARGGARVLYVSGEESAAQLRMRAQRLSVEDAPVHVLSETDLERAQACWESLSPQYMVVDSVQTVYRPDAGGAPGSVTQVREAAAVLMRMAKTTGCAVFLIGHVTKDGSIAGPRMLEHMVDAVLYFEGDRRHGFRMLRAAKNRFGSVNELGVFRMTGAGMECVDNPSQTLLSERSADMPGSCVLCALEGTRPMLVDVQALTARTAFSSPRRTAAGLDAGRLSLLLAVLEKRAGLAAFDQDVYVNVAGGLELTEPAADLAVLAAVASSLRGQGVPPGLAAMGEVGLAGEVRAVSQLERRLNECRRLGFEGCVVPRAGLEGVRAPPGLRVYGARTLREALELLLG